MCDTEQTASASSSPASLTLPQLETIDRIMRLPVVENAWNQGQDVYGKVKKSNTLINWALSTTEDAIQRTAAVAAPFVHKLDAPINLVDRTLAKGIDKLEDAAPIIKEQPQEIYQQTKTRVMDTLQSQLEMVSSIRAIGQERATTMKQYTMQKANNVLSTKYGVMAINRVDSTSVLAEKMLDYYLPATDSDASQFDSCSIIPFDENPLLHTIQTVGNLSKKIVLRFISSVLYHLQQLRKQDVQEYVNALIAILRLTDYLNLIRPKKFQKVTEDGQKQNN